jgi:hypothetical protein
MKKGSQIFGVFLSVVAVLIGSIILMGMDLEIVSRPLDPNASTWRVYYLDFRNAPNMFYIGCGLVAAGLTFLRCQKQS